MKQLIITVLTVIIYLQATSAQIVKPVKWVFSTRQVDNEQVDLIFKATINSPWHMYGLNIAEGGPIPASIHFTEASGYELAGKLTQSPKPIVVDDKIFNMKLELHSGQVTFTQRIKKIQRDSVIVNGTLEYMTCSDMQCVLGDADFSFRLAGVEKVKTASKETAPSQVETPTTAGATADTITAQQQRVVPLDTIEGQLQAAAPATNAKKSLWGLLLLSLLAGLGGLLTPCVYPMIPMTVSYFMRGKKSRSRAISEALVFGLSIVFLYTLIGVLVAIFKNPNAVNNFTSHWITNLIFFLIFILLSSSFFGMFEIMLPSGLANKVDRQADKGGYIGAFFMALAMAILSFSCTGPIVASLLIKASQGEVLEPIVGMAGFSIVFALPFTLFAIFPAWLQGLPKSGGWLNAVKVFFAFIMLAFSFYFLGKIDQSYHLNLLSRNLFISIWVVIFALLGLYLIGKIKFAHDSELTYIGVPRLLFSVASFTFALYLFTGLFGNELKGLSSILPPAAKNDIGQPSGSATNKIGQPHWAAPTLTNICNTPKYSDFLNLPHNLQGYFDYEEALACAREQGKPVLVDFVGHTCSNCKKMYAEVWSDPRVLELLGEKFIIVALYTDDKTKLPELEWITSKVDGKVKNAMGKKNQDFQISRFNSNALPLYAIVDGNGNDLSATYYTYDPNVEKFIAWLEDR
jgi:thiol:disulfide interchange protein